MDAADWADHALTDAAGHHGDVARWLRLDIEQDDWGPLHDTGYALITLRLVYAFFRDRARVMRELGRRLRPGGAVVVITPLAAGTPPERRAIASIPDRNVPWARSDSSLTGADSPPVSWTGCGSTRRSTTCGPSTISPSGDG